MQAERTPRGRARLTLVAALLDVPDWFGSSPRGARRLSVDARATSLITWLRSDTLPLVFAARAELEQSASGNPSWNTGVNYATPLAHSVDSDDVQTLYQQVRLSLAGDLRVLAHAPRVAAAPGAARYLARNITLTGRLRIPVLTLHTTGGQIAPVERVQDYADRVRTAGDERLLRQLFVQ